MKCQYCNNEISEKDNYCNNCGKAIESSDIDKQQQEKQNLHINIKSQKEREEIIKGKPNYDQEPANIEKNIEQKENNSSFQKPTKLKEEIINKNTKPHYKKHMNNPFINKWLVPFELILSLILTYLFFLIITSSIQKTYPENSDQESIQSVKNDSLNVDVGKDQQKVAIGEDIDNSIRREKESHIVIITKRLFNTNSSSIIWVIPYLIFGVFIFLILDILYKVGITLTFKRQLEKINIDQVLESARNIKSKKDFNIDFGEIQNTQIVKRYIKNLISNVLYQLKFGIKENNINENFRQFSDDECEKALNSFSLPKLLIWAMPILGFIGTVVGIGLAIGNLSGFLEGDIEDVAKVKVGLANISTGLSYAFDTTLLGLAASLISMIPTTFSQNLVISAYSQFELLSEELLEDHYDFSEEYYNEKLSFGVEVSVKSLEKRTNDIGRNLGKLNEKNNKLTQELNKSVDLIESSLKSFQSTLENSLINPTYLTDKIIMVNNSINTQNDNINNGFKELNDINISYIKTLNDNNELSRNLIGIIDEMQKSQGKISKLLNSFDGGFEFKFIKSEQ